ncbi:MAG: response regulator [Flavobacteriales bacterium]|nr:response regulator [Flavobacteriales bacterium]
MNKPKIIYIIEDSKILSGIMALVLKGKFNCKTIVFENGDDAMMCLQSFTPDLIVLDYNFNNKELKYNNGLDFLITLRKKLKIPVIIYSGQGDKVKAVKVIKEGANDYISKGNDDSMSSLLDATKDIFEIQSAKKSIKSFKTKLEKQLLFFILLIVLTTGFLYYIFN